jgi:hypothetical protein
MKHYPRINVRVTDETRARLKAMAFDFHTKPSKIVQAAVHCVLNNPKCFAKSFATEKGSK